MNITNSYKSLGLALLATTALALVGCGGERSDATGGALKVNSPAKIVNESADNYDDNVNGLITYKTLKGWIDNWDKNKPAGIKGKLVIFQQTKGPVGAEFIKPNIDKGVFSYVEGGWTEDRFNGVNNIQTVVLSGPSIDSLVRKYGIDLENDMLVCAQGTANNSAFFNQGRCWFAFSYWGVDQKNIALLNGGNAYLSEKLGEKYFTNKTVDSKNPSPIINRQVSSVKDLKSDNFELYASLEDVINVLPVKDRTDLNDDVLLWDARSLSQYSAGAIKWGTEADQVVVVEDGNVQGSFQNNAARQSHPRGALNLEFTNMLDPATGVYYDKDVLAGIVNGQASPDKKQSFVDGSNKAVAEGSVYKKGDTIIHYCETSMRAGVTIIATGVVLGYPTRLYDAAMVEWNSLTSSVKDKNDQVILPVGSPWDTELLSAPVGVYGDNPAPRSTVGYAVDKGEDADEIAENLSYRPMIVSPFATSSDAVVVADRAYKAPVVEEKPSTEGNAGGSTGGGLNTGNPCG